MLRLNPFYDLLLLTRLVFHHGCYYLTSPHEVPPVAADNQGRLMALDPGVCSFLTRSTLPLTYYLD